MGIIRDPLRDPRCSVNTIWRVARPDRREALVDVQKSAARPATGSGVAAAMPLVLIWPVDNYAGQAMETGGTRSLVKRPGARTGAYGRCNETNGRCAATCDRALPQAATFPAEGPLPGDEVAHSQAGVHQSANSAFDQSDVVPIRNLLVGQTAQ